MAVFSAAEFDDHQLVQFVSDRASGLKAVIAIHRAQPVAGGGIRMKPYASEADAVRDVLRLSRAMTYKWAFAGLAPGGGKTVVIGDPRREKSPKLLHALARAIDRLGGKYIAGSDVGTSSEDMRLMQQVTRHVRGADAKHGDSSEATAYGVLQGIRATATHLFGSPNLKDVCVAVQGVGHVGERLCALLAAEGAKLIVADVNADAVARVCTTHGARAVDISEILSVEADILAPCALGAVVDDPIVPTLRIKAICGAANNQLAEDRHALDLHRRGILFAPDFVVNAGGAINGTFEGAQYDRDRVWRRLDNIYDSCLMIFARAKEQGSTTLHAAEAIARELVDGSPAAR